MTPTTSVNLVHLLRGLSIFALSFYGLSFPASQNLDHTPTIPNEPFNSTSSGLAADIWKKCDPNVYGNQLNVSSCFNAWGKIPRDRELYLYGTRLDIAAGMRLDVGLPVRYLSDDGLCAIDLTARREYRLTLQTADRAENIEISDAAREIINRCVLPSGREGGYYAGFSREGLIAIVVRKHESKAVCNTTPRQVPYPQFCERVLQTMLVRTQLDTFIHEEDRRHGNRYYGLPKVFDFPSGGVRCSFSVSMTNQLPLTKARWFDLWAAGIDIYSKCIKHGMSGSVARLGDNRQLYVTMEGEGAATLPQDRCASPYACDQNLTAAVKLEGSQKSTM